MGWVVKLLSGVGKAVLWIAKLAFNVAKWATAHPVVAIIVVIGTYLLSNWLDEQTWTGASTVSSLVSGLGYTMMVGVGWKILVTPIFWVYQGFLLIWEAVFGTIWGQRFFDTTWMLYGGDPGAHLPIPY